MDQGILRGRRISSGVRIQQGSDLEFVSVEDGREIGHLSRAGCWDESDVVSQACDSFLREKARRRFQIPVIRQTLEHEVPLLSKETLGEVVSQPSWSGRSAPGITG
jgi:hypothetical protein